MLVQVRVVLWPVISGDEVYTYPLPLARPILGHSGMNGRMLYAAVCCMLACCMLYAMQCCLWHTGACGICSLSLLLALPKANITHVKISSPQECTLTSDNLRLLGEALHLLAEALHYRLEMLHLLAKALHLLAEALHLLAEALHLLAKALHLRAELLHLLAALHLLTEALKLG